MNISLTGTNQRYSGILDITEKCILTHGFNKTTMKVIAKKRGISRRTLYRTFSTRSQLLTALFKKHIDNKFKETKNFISRLEFDEAIIQGTIYGINLLQKDHLIMELTYGSGSSWFQKQMLDYDSPLYQLILSTDGKFWGSWLDQAKEDGIINRYLTNSEILGWYCNVQYMMIIHVSASDDDKRSLLEKFFLPSLKGDT